MEGKAFTSILSLIFLIDKLKKNVFQYVSLV